MAGRRTSMLLLFSALLFASPLLPPPLLPAEEGAPVPAGRPGDLAGRLLRSGTGMPAGGVVRARLADGSLREGRAGPDGLFLVAGLPAAVPVDLEIRSGDLPPLPLRRLVLREDGPSDAGDIDVGAAVPLEVRVVDPLGRPLGGQAVTLHRLLPVFGGHGETDDSLNRAVPPPVEAEASTAPETGIARFSALPGYVAVQVAREGCARAVKSLRLREGEAGEPLLVVLEPEAEVEGDLRDPDGRPVAGAFISLWTREFPLYAPGMVEDGAATGSDGSFRVRGLHPGLHALTVRIGEDRRYLVRDVLAGRGGPLRLVLPGGASLAVRVVAAEDGVPLPGVPVHLEVHQESAPNWTSTFRARTGGDGTAAFPDLPPGTIHALRPLVPGRVPTAELTSRTGRWELRAGLPRTEEVRVPRGSALSGTIHYPSGAPVPGARVRVVVVEREGEEEKSFPPARCDGAGRFRIEGVPTGRAEIAYEPPSTPTTGVEDPWYRYTSGDGGLWRTGLIVEEGPPKENHLVINALPPGFVEGVIRDGNGLPVPGAGVKAFARSFGRGGDGWEAIGHAVASGPDGSFRVPVSRIVHEVACWGWGTGGRRAWSEVLKVGDDGRATGAVVTLAAGASMEGRVTTREGEALPGARLLLFPGKVDREESWKGRNFSVVPRAVPVGVGGEFRVHGLTAGSWTLLARAPGCEPVLAEPVTLEPGGTLRGETLSLPPSAVFEGVVVDPDGKGIPGAVIGVEEVAEDRRELPREIPGEAPLVTDAAGRFRRVGGPEGRYALTVEARGWREAVVPCSSGDRAIRIPLRPALAIAGRVVDADTGEPVPGLEIECGRRFEIGRTRPAVITDARGAFRVEGLAPGTHGVEAGRGSDGREDYAPLEHRRVPAGTEDLVIRLHVGLAIEGRILDAAGLTVADRWVEAEMDREPTDAGEEEPAVGPPNYLHRQIATGPDGRFVLAGLLEGTYRVSVDDGNTRGDASPPFPMERRGVPAGTRDLLLVERRGTALLARFTGAKGEGDEPSGLRVFVRRRLAPRPGDPDHREPDPIEEDLGPMWALWMPVPLEEDGTLAYRPAVEGESYQVFALDEAGRLWGRGEGPAGPGRVLTVVLGPYLSVEGTVVDEEGNPVPPGTPVGARSAGDLPFEVDVAWGRTGAEGAFRVEGLVEGKCGVWAGGGDSGFLASSLEELVPAGSAGHRIVLRRGVEIEGRIVDRSGRPGRAEGITAYGEDSRSEAEVAEDGSFRVRGLAPGKVRLQVWVSGRDDRGVAFTYTLEFIPAAAPSSGVEVDITALRLEHEER